MLTLGIIAKSNSTGFRDLINSALPYVQQVIVAVDDGAEPGIYGYMSDRVEYFNHPLNMNFASMRNAVCERVSNHWVLFMDTDENLKPCCWEKLDEWMKIPVDVLLFSRCNYYLLDCGDLDGPKNFPDWQPRLLRRHVRWTNAVHEWPVGPVQIQNLPADNDYAIQHIKTNLDQHIANQLYANINAIARSD